MTKRKIVLIGKGQTTMGGEEAARLVTAGGFQKAAAKLGVSESYLRKFLRDEGFRFSRRTSWQVETLPGLEAVDGSNATEAAAPAGAADPGEHAVTAG